MAKSECKVRLLDEVSAVVVGVHDDHMLQLHNKFAVLTANYFFNPRFKLGQWDGKIRYFSKTGKTFIYLLEEILPMLTKFGYNVTIEDIRTTHVDYPDEITGDVFSHILHIDTGKPIVLRPDQVEAVNKLIQAGSGICLAGTGAGKAQALDSKILTPGGWKRMGEMQIGDQVLTPKNTTATVTGVFPQGQKDLYRVVFHDGSSTLCCDEHLWTVKMPAKSYRANTVVQTVPLSTMREFLDQKSAGVTHIPGNITIPVTAAIEYAQPASVPIDPYLLGVLIGDGSLSSRSISISTADTHILNKVKLLVDRYGVSVKFGAGVDYRLSNIKPQNCFPPSKNNLTEAIAKVGLMGTTSGNKFIPAMYKMASVEDRTNLIQGLFDTDGTVDKRGNVSFTTTSEQLAVDVQEIVWSLGATCTITTRNPSYTYRGQKKQGSKAFTLVISSPTSARFFSLPRKVERCNASFGNGRITHGRRVVSIKHERVDLAQCIMIDDDDHLYITDDYVVTHNTLMCSALVQAHDKIGVKSLTIVPDQGLIRQTKAEYINCGLDAGEYSGSVKTLDHQHVVSTWQALKNNPKIVELFEMVIVDECLDGNTQILLEDGSTKPIAQCKVGDRVISYNVDTGEFEPDVVVKLHTNLAKSSQERMYNITFDNGAQLNVTGNHNILTNTGYVRADELTEEHDVVSW